MAGRSQSGIALVAVLWAVTLLSAMATALIAEGRSEGRVTSMASGKAQADALADAGIYEAIRRLLEPRLRDALAVNGTPFRWRFADADIQIMVQDEAGKVDLNDAPVELLATVFRGAGTRPQQADALADAVADWRDGDDLIRVNGAEAVQYRMAALPYGPANARFHAVAELRLVKGVNDALFDRLAPAVTVYSGQSGVDPLSATRWVLEMQQAGAGKNAGAASGATDRATASMVGGASSALGASSIGGHAFTIRALVTVDNARAVREAVVRISEDLRRPYWVYAWHDGIAGDP